MYRVLYFRFPHTYAQNHLIKLLALFSLRKSSEKSLRNMFVYFVSNLREQQQVSYLPSFPSGTFHTCLGSFFAALLFSPNSSWIPFPPPPPLRCPGVQFFSTPPQQVKRGQGALTNERSPPEGVCGVFQRFMFFNGSERAQHGWCQQHGIRCEPETTRKRNGFMFFSNFFLFLKE